MPAHSGGCSQSPAAGREYIPGQLVTNVLLVKHPAPVIVRRDRIFRQVQQGERRADVMLEDVGVNENTKAVGLRTKVVAQERRPVEQNLRFA